MENDLISLFYIFFILGSAYICISFIFYYSRNKMLNHIKQVIEQNIYVKAKIINQKKSIAGDEGDISFIITYSYPWEGKEYKNSISVKKKFFYSTKNEKYLYVYLDPDNPGKTYLESKNVVYTGPIVLFVLWIVFMGVGLAFIFAAFILFGVDYYVSDTTTF